jgi:hypothetical protein
MPKIPPKSKKKFTVHKPVRLNQRVSTHKVANQLLDIEIAVDSLKEHLDQIKQQVDSVWTILYTKGITDRGPLKETDDDFPF